jgi:hypothetical protein
MRKVFELCAVAAIVALLAFWHGATQSPASKAALYLFPVMLAFGLAWRSRARMQKRSVT